MVRVLITDERVKEDIKKVKDYALKNPYRLIDGKLEKDIIPGDNPDHVIFIPLMFRVVYSITVISGIAYQHLSISTREKETPSIPEAEMILKLFGMGTNVNDLYTVYLEEEINAINLIKEL